MSSKKPNTNLSPSFPRFRALTGQQPPTPGHSRDGDTTPELIANTIVNEMTNKKAATNPVEMYFKTNKLGFDQSSANFLYGDDDADDDDVDSSTEATAAAPVVGHGYDEHHKQRSAAETARENKIRYTLDMVVDHLVSQGKINPAHSYQLNTPKMRQHIGRMVDKIALRHHLEEFDTKMINHDIDDSSVIDVSESFANKYGISNHNSLKPAGVKLEAATKGKKLTMSGKTFSKSTSKPKPKPAIAGPSHGRREPLTSKKDPEAGPLKMKPEMSSAMDEKPEKPNTSRASARFRQNSFAPPLPTAAISFTSKQLLDETNLLSPERLAKFPEFVVSNESDVAPVEAYCAKVDLRGFKEQHISLTLTGRRLTITADRPNDFYNSKARKTIEIIDIPKGIHFENIKIDKRQDGYLYIQEVVPESQTNLYASYRRKNLIFLPKLFDDKTED